MLVKVILFLPGAISGVMFPKVSRAYAQKEDTSKILYRSILFTLLLSITVALVYILAPSLILNVLVPGKYPIDPTGAVMQWLVVAMVMLGMANLFMLYGFATDHNAYVIITAISIVVLGLLISIILASGTAFTPILLAQVMMITGIFIVVSNTIYFVVFEHKQSKNNCLICMSIERSENCTLIQRSSFRALLFYLKIGNMECQGKGLSHSLAMDISNRIILRS